MPFSSDFSREVAGVKEKKPCASLAFFAISGNRRFSKEVKKPKRRRGGRKKKKKKKESSQPASRASS